MVTAEDDAGLCRWREGADKMLESDPAGGKRAAPPQTLNSAFHPTQVKRGFPSCLPYPHLLPPSSPHLQGPILGLLNLEGKKKH